MGLLSIISDKQNKYRASNCLFLNIFFLLEAVVVIYNNNVIVDHPEETKPVSQKFVFMKKILNLCSNTLDDWIARSSMNLT